MALEKVQNLLPRMVQRAGISRQLEASMVCEAVDKEIKRIFGDRLGGQAKALYYRENTLTLAVLNSVLAQEIRFREAEMLDFLNKRFGEGKVERIRYLM